MFLDISMPKMNGYDVCKNIKQDPELQDIYIIMLTAKGQTIDKVQAEEVRANEYMTKPFNPDVILEKACKALGIEL